MKLSFKIVVEFDDIDVDVDTILDKLMDEIQMAIPGIIITEDYDICIERTEMERISE